MSTLIVSLQQTCCTDLRNGPLHCLGIHSKCSTDYCQVAKTAALRTNTSADTTHTGSLSTSPGDLVADTVDQEIQQWEDALDEDNMEEIRHDTTPAPSDLDPAMMWDIQRIVGCLIAKAD